ncbi:serine/threonine-protein kinase [Shewanella sedimentimangrovi]|uniref:Protein kinase n=1 Tax=Shewanella sedimentimangrovi TaxID=2814293 RepID=A0ABX7R2Z0_9GAMM|nr:serine/threonine-protein kinase [Shewanella sedimentimangrovi]QSX37526.1 protein kinase [Shewanella sedimentimangrovi]
MAELKRIKALFDSCIELPPHERLEFLNHSDCCDTERREVLRLLEHVDVSSTTVLTGQARNLIGSQLRELGSQLTEGQQLGPYRIIEKIGTGGMGVVFLAERADGQYEQKVAIKLAPAMVAGEDQQHFTTERQLLAKLQHPHIAMLLDGGLTEDARPFLVMEFVEGQNLKEYCLGKKLPLTERLGLFLRVCDAVSFAHSHLIIHCDLKPENVLVNHNGLVKLLDFGTSRMLNQGQDQDSAARMLAMTLSCASPEQVRGDQPTTATDVYGLGSLLYQLLTGEAPLPVDRDNMCATLEHIANSKPKAPGALLRPNASGLKRFPRDLDNIVLKALEKRPEDRYASVGELAWDIKRFLKGQTVSATRHTPGYRFGKLLGRHPLASLLTGGLLISLLGGLGVSLHLTHKLGQEVATSNQVIQLLTETFEEASPEKAQGHPVDIQQFVKTMVRQTTDALNDSPEVKIRLLQSLVAVTQAVGQDQEAARLQQAVLELKLNHGISEGLAFDRAKLGNIYLKTNRVDEGRLLLQQAHGELTATTGNNSQLAMVKAFLSRDAINQGKLDEALTLVSQALALYKSLPQKDYLQLKGLQLDLTAAYYHNDRFKEAAQTARELVTDMATTLGAGHPFLVNAYADAGLYSFTEDPALALQLTEKGYRLAQETLEPNNSARINAVSRHADVLKKSGDVIAAIAVLEQELSPALNEDNVSLLLRQRAPGYMLLGYYDKALADLQRVYDINAKKFPPESARVFPLIGMRGIATAILGQPALGRELINQAIKYNSISYGKDNPGVATSEMYLAHVAMMQQEYQEAESLLQGAEKIFSTVVAPDAFIFGQTASVYVLSYMAQSKWQEAKPYAEKSVAIFHKSYPPGTPTTAQAESRLGEILWHLGEQKQGAELIEQSFAKVQPLGNESTIYLELEQRRQWLQTAQKQEPGSDETGE